MSAEDFAARADEILGAIKDTQLAAIKAAAELIAGSAAQGGALHYFDNGHCTGELLGRAGGFFAIHPIRFGVNVEHAVPPSHKGEPSAGAAHEEQVLDLLVDRLHFRAGDVLYLCSVTGSSPLVVTLALGARRRGVKVVALTSPTYSRAIVSRHSSGKFLYEVADLVIDNCGPVGDACLEIPGLDTPACPSSGLAFVYISWMLFAQVMRNLLDRGIVPHIYKSISLPGAKEFNDAAKAEYERTGI